LNKNNIHNIITKCYQQYLNREPDDAGLKHYTHLMKTNQLDEKSLIVIFKESSEYKLSHPIELEPNTPVDVKMKKEWNARTKMDPLFVIATGPSKSKDSFWKSGVDDCNNILGKDSKRFDKILGNKKPTEMKILEIGCGVGRILVPMSDIFGNIIGIDIASEMVELGQKYVSGISNCSIVENNGIDLSEFSDNSFDFCYSFIVFQHIPEKQIVENYIKEVSRILKPSCLFRFQVRGTISTKPTEITTWDGVQFTSDEIHRIAKDNNFEIIEEGNYKDEYYWLTFKVRN
jgi:ubiquinone/menaquinone biosynthesis C-methylase UbiE